MPARVALASAALAALALPVFAARASAQYGEVPAPATLPCSVRTPLGVASVVPPAVTVNDLAVLEFRSAAPPNEIAYLGDGLANGLARRFARVTALRLRSLTPIRRSEPHTSQEVITLGAQTGARYVLAGEAHPTQNGVRVRANLYRTVDGIQVAGEVVEVKRDQLLQLEERLALAVARRVAPSLTRAELQAIGRAPTRDPVAYERLMYGDALAAQRTPVSISEAVYAYNEAVVRDPKFAEAYTRIADAHAELLSRGWGAASASEQQLAKLGLAAANRAIALDSSSAPAWAARGRLLALTDPRASHGAWTAFVRALALAPHHALVWQAFGRSRLDAWDLTSAEAQLERAVALDPHDANAFLDLGDLRLYRRDFDGACRALNQAIAADPWNPYAYSLRALARLRLGEIRDAWGDAETAARLGRSLDGQAVTAVVDAQARDSAKAVLRLRPYVPPRGSTEKPGPLSAWEGRLLALAAAAVGDSDKALGFLDRVRPRGAGLWTVMQDPGFDPVRADPRFARLAEASRPPGARGIPAIARPSGAKTPQAVNAAAQAAKRAKSPAGSSRARGATATARVANQAGAAPPASPGSGSATAAKP